MSINRKINQVINCQFKLIKLYSELMAMADIEGVENEDNWTLDLHGIGGSFSNESLKQMVEVYQQIKKNNLVP